MKQGLALLCAIAFPACNLQIAASDSTITIEGRVTSSGSAVDRATVSVAADSVTTDINGEYHLRVKPEKDRVTVKIERAGFAPTLTVLTRRASVFHYNADVELIAPTKITMPMTGGGMMNLMLSAGGQNIGVQVPPGALPPGATLEITALPAGAGPGAMETTEGQDQRLQTGGMLHIRAVDQAGNEVKLMGDGLGITPATMKDVAMAGETKAYQLDEEAVWTPKTGTNAMGANLRAQEAGYWNADRRYQTSCVRGKVNAPRKACAGQNVKAGGLDGLFTNDTTGPDGQFCVEGPQGYAQSITIGRMSTGVTFPSSAGSCRTNPNGCKEIPAISVADTDCPKSCDKTEIDTPTDCKPKPTGTGGGNGGNGGGNGGTTNTAGFTCATTQSCSAWNAGSMNLGCKWRACACVDANGNCPRSWYETNGGKAFACAMCSSSCSSAATALISSCK